MALTLCNKALKRVMHRETYDFASFFEDEQLRRKPRRYFLLGFMDRNLEQDYLADLATRSSTRIGCGLSLLLVLTTYNCVWVSGREDNATTTTRAH